MPRGAISKRSAKPGAPGPPGPSGLGVLAFPDIATMAAFPMGPYVDGVDAHVLTLDDMWSYDPGSVLVPDVSAAAPLGITIVAASGPGNWTRREETSRRWRDRPNWFVDPVAGSDEASGTTALTPIGSFAEFLRRVQGLPEAAAGVAWDVTILSDVTEQIMIDTRALSGAEYLLIHADPIVLFSSAITAHVDYNDATQTVGTITIAGLPVSFTASGLVGKLARIPSTGVEFWIMQDMGAKTARISPPQLGTFVVDVGVVTNVVVEIYDLVQFGTEVTVLSEGGPTQQVDFETLELGATGGAHVFATKAGLTNCESCYVNGLDITNSEASFYNCSLLEFRAAEGSSAILANGYCAPGGGSVQVRGGGGVAISRFASYTTYLVQQRGLVTGALLNGWALFLGAAGFGFQVEPGGLIDAARGVGAPIRLWTIDMVAGTAVNVLPNGRIVYEQTTPILTNAPTVQVQLGNLAITLAQLPYTSPIDQAAVVANAAPNNVEDQYVPCVADVAAAGAIVTIVTSTITVNGTRQVQVWSEFAVQLSAAANVNMILQVDGVTVRSSLLVSPVGFGPVMWGGLNYSASLAAGAHTIRLAFGPIVAGVALCNCATAPLDNHATLIIKELYG